MRTIRVSEEVWQVIANHGKFGETEDDVLHRLLKLPPQVSTETLSKPSDTSAGRLPRRSFATQRLSSNIDNNQLHVTFQDGAARSWPLPSRSDKAGIKIVRDKAVSFVKEKGATLGQINAVKKTLTDNGYHLTK